MDMKAIGILFIGIIIGGSVGYTGSYLLQRSTIDGLKADLADLEASYATLSTQQDYLQQEYGSILAQFETLSDQFEGLVSRHEELLQEREELVERVGELTLELARNIKINEVLFNPLGADGGNEWVELFNSGEAVIDLSGWTITGSEGIVKATIPSMAFPPGAYLIVHFGPVEPGMIDTDFRDDGQAYYFVGTLEEIFDNDADAVALYMGDPSSETIVDYIAWKSDKGESMKTAENHASNAFIWKEGEFVDTSYDSGNFVIQGETIGRGSYSVDTNGPGDWDDNGGQDAWGPTEGRRNSGPLYTYDVALFLSQFDVNTIMWEYGLNVGSVHAHDIQVNESESLLIVIMDYEFIVDVDGSMIPFRGICTHKWWADNTSGYHVTIDVQLASNRGEVFTLSSYRYDTGVETLRYESTRNLSASFVGQDGLVIPYFYEGTRTINHIAQDTFRTDDSRAVTGLDGVARTVNAAIVEVTTSDITSRFVLDAMMISEVESPELVHIETYIEMDGDRQFNITMPIQTRQYQGYEFSLLEPATIEFRRVAGQPRDSFGQYEYVYRCTMGNPQLGYANFTVTLYEDYTKVDGKPVIRGETKASLDGYHVVTYKFYVYDWWRRALRTGLRIVSGTAWAVGCFAGTVVGTPTCAGKFVAVGACAAGGVATDSLISDLMEEKK